MNTKAPFVVVEAPALVGPDPHGMARKLLDTEKRERLQCLVHALVQSFAALLQARVTMPPDWPVTVNVSVRAASWAAPKLGRLRLKLVFHGPRLVEVTLVAEGAADRAGLIVELRARYDRRPELPRPPGARLASPPPKKVVRVVGCEEFEVQHEAWRQGCDQELLLRGFWNLQGHPLQGAAIFVDRDGRVLAEINRLRLLLVASDDCPEDVARVDVRLPAAFDRERSRSPRRA